MLKIMSVVIFVLLKLLKLLNDIILVDLSIHDNNDFLALDIVLLDIAFQGFDLVRSMIFGLTNLSLDLLNLIFVFFFDSPEFLFLQFMNFFFVLFNIFIFKNIDKFLNFVLFAEFFLKNFPNYIASASDFRQTANEDGVVRQRTCTFIVVLFLLDENVSDTDQGHQVNQKRYYSQEIVLVLVLTDENGKVYHKTCAMCGMVVLL
jgi:hypothetical protein